MGKGSWGRVGSRDECATEESGRPVLLGDSVKNSKLGSFMMPFVLEKHSWCGVEAALEREGREAKGPGRRWQ